MTVIKILVLGSGMVARPCVEYLVRDSKNHVTVAISLDVSNSADLEKAIADHDLVISLVPYVYHAAVIKLAIKYKINVVTTSYVSPAIRELDVAAKDAGTVVLNEVG
ncbi:MAG: hypothetical protein Q9163_003588, partial [Psora crenata]